MSLFRIPRSRTKKGPDSKPSGRTDEPVVPVKPSSEDPAQDFLTIYQKLDDAKVALADSTPAEVEIHRFDEAIASVDEQLAYKELELGTCETFIESYEEQLEDIMRRIKELKCDRYFLVNKKKQFQSALIGLEDYLGGKELEERT